MALRWWAILTVVTLAVTVCAAGTVAAQTAATSAVPALGTPLDNPLGIPDLSKIAPPVQTREGMSSAIQIMLLLTVLTLAPAILVLMTSFTRIIVVLSLLRQALATQTLPPNQVLIGLALLMTFMIMSPVLQEINHDAFQPYMNGQMGQMAALEKAAVPVRRFMIRQIENAGNQADVRMFLEYSGHGNVEKFSEVPTLTLIPAFVTSELKIAFLMGFKIYLPFLIIDMVVSSILISMGMLMLPPVLISLPFKLLLFVLVDGWHLVIGGLLMSFN
jgi:flagellar biosynthetic protein FliP